MRYIIVFIILFCASLSAHAQVGSTDDFSNQVIESMHALRGFALKQGDPEAFRNVLRTFKGEESYQVVWQGLINGYYRGKDVDFIRKKIYEKIEEPDSIHLLTQHHIDVIKQNHMLAALIMDGVVEGKPAMKLTNSSEWVKELSFFAVNAGQTVLEVGAGNGSFGLLAATVFPNATFILNEVDSSYMERLRMVTKAYGQWTNQKNIFTSFGDERHTGVRGKVDKVIMRRTFHHFTHAEDMLSDIKSIIRPSSLVYIAERKKSTCPYFMRENKIRSIMKSNGFKIQDEFDKRRFYVLAFRLKQ